MPEQTDTPIMYGAVLRKDIIYRDCDGSIYQREIAYAVATYRAKDDQFVDFDQFRFATIQDARLRLCELCAQFPTVIQPYPNDTAALLRLHELLTRSANV